MCRRSLICLVLLLHAASHVLSFDKEAEKQRMVNEALHAYAQLFIDSWGTRLPSDEFIQAVRSAAFRPKLVSGSMAQNPLVLLTLANHYALNHTAKVFVGNLAKLGLAQHLVIVYIGGGGGMEACGKILSHGMQCVLDQARTHPSSSVVLEGAFGSSSRIGLGHASFLSTGFSRILAILDTLSLGMDCLFLDSDQVFFRDPLPYLLDRDADVIVTGDCAGRDDRVGSFTLPPTNNNIGLLLFKAQNPGLVRCISDWLYRMVSSAMEFKPQWDQTTFQPAMERCTRKFNLSMIMLRPDRFPYTCMGPCGCNITGISDVDKGNASDFITDPSAAVAAAAATSLGSRLICPLSSMKEWIGFHFPCVVASQKHGLMTYYLEMWENGTGHKVGEGG